MSRPPTRFHFRAQVFVSKLFVCLKLGLADHHGISRGKLNPHRYHELAQPLGIPFDAADCARINSHASRCMLLFHACKLLQEITEKSCADLACPFYVGGGYLLLIHAVSPKMTETEKLLRQARAIALAVFPDAGEKLLATVLDRQCIERDMETFAPADTESESPPVIH